MNKYYTYAVFPTGEQKDILTGIYGCSRYVYNKGLMMRMAGYSTGEIPDYHEVSRRMTQVRHQYKWLEECPYQVVQDTLRELGKDWNKAIPQYRKKTGVQSIVISTGFRIRFREGVIKMPRIGAIACKYDRRFTGLVKYVKLYKTLTGRYYIQVAVVHNPPVVKVSICADNSIGISKGINTLYGLSNGQRISNPMHIQDTEKKLQREKRKLSRCTGQSNKKKQQYRVLKIQEHLNNQRRDYIQKASTKMIREYSTIIIENTGGLLEKILRYKCMWYGNNLIEVNKCQPCPDMCSQCGHIERSQGVAWTCKCGIQHNRNRNNAQNIKNIGIKQQRNTVATANTIV